MDVSDPRKTYPTDVTDDEWAFVAPYLTLLDPDAPQRRHDPRIDILPGEPVALVLGRGGREHGSG